MMAKMSALIGVIACAGVGGVAAAVITRGPASCDGVALTFDLCPVRDAPGFDQPLVDLLIEKQIPATFFVSGRWAVRHEEELQRLLAVPFFEIGTHGQVHAHLPELDEDSQRREIEAAVALLRDRFGRATTLFRPPYGEYNELTVQLADALGLRVVLWNIVSGDPDPRLSQDAIVTVVTERLRRGSIAVFHANGKGRHTKAVIGNLAPMLASRGLQPMTVSTLLDQCPHDIGRH